MTKDIVFMVLLFSLIGSFLIAALYPVFTSIVKKDKKDIKKDKKDSEISFKISIIKNADDSDVITGKFPNFGGYDEGTFLAFEKEAERILTENPFIAILFQHGAVLKVEIKDPHSVDNVKNESVWMQILTISDDPLHLGFIGVGKLRTKHIPLCIFKVRLIKKDK